MLKRNAYLGSAALVMLLTAGAATALATGCGGSGANKGFGDGDGGAGLDADIANLGDVMIPDGGKPATETKLYAHTNKKLYSVDTKDLSNLTDLGEFDCIQSGAGSKFTSMTDIAVDRDGKLFGVAENAVFLDMKISGAGVSCGTSVTLTTPGKFYGASMAPKGLLYPDREALLVADSAGDIYDVNTTTGDSTKVGNFGVVPRNDGRGFSYPTKNVGEPWALSGDIVFLENKGNPIAFATVRDCDSNNKCSTTDTLIQLDPKLLGAGNKVVTSGVRGAVRKASNCADTDNPGYGSIYGVAAFGDQIIGFSRTTLPNGGGLGAFIVKINNTDGKACLVADVGTQIGSGWAGAGVTTIVDVVPPVN